MPLKARAGYVAPAAVSHAGPGHRAAVTEGQAVKAGDPLAVVEAMKMENVLLAERDGTIAKILAKKGRQSGPRRCDHGIRDEQMTTSRPCWSGSKALSRASAFAISGDGGGPQQAGWLGAQSLRRLGRGAGERPYQGGGGFRRRGHPRSARRPGHGVDLHNSEPPAEKGFQRRENL